jgi:translocation and assembly module TamB
VSQPQLPPDRNTPQLARQLGRLAVGMGLGLTAVTLGGLWYVRHYINTQLTPQIQQELTRQLQRPVVLGEVQRATLGGLRLGKSAIPVTTTAQDFFNIEAIEVKLDLWQYLRTGRVGVDISADGVSAFIPQQVEPILPPDQPPPTTIPVQPTVVETPSLVNLQSLQISNGEVVIRGGADGKLVAIKDVQITAQLNLTDQARQTITLDATGKFGQAGTLNIAGEYVLTNASGNLQVKLQQIDSAPLQSLLVGVPVIPQAGRLNADVKLVLAENGVIQNLQGSAQLDQVTLLTTALPQPISQISGKLQVEGLTLTIPKLQGKVGAIATQVSGTIGLEKGDLDLQLVTAKTAIADLVASTGIKLPITLDGAIQLTSTIKGTTALPQISAELSAPDTLLIDRVAVANFQGKFSSAVNQQNQFSLNIDRLSALVQGGGELQGRGRLSEAGIDGELQLTGINAEVIAQLYDTKLPVTVGNISATVRATGKLDKPLITAQISAPQSEYPAEVALELKDGLAVIRRARVDFPDLGGSADLTGTYNFTAGSWEAQVTAEALPLRLISAEERGTVNLQANLQSDRPSFELADIKGSISAELPQGLNAIPEGISANGTWDGQNLRLAKARVGDLLSLSGRLGIVLPQGIKDVDLVVSASGVRLNRLSLLLPKISPTAQGLISFQGSLVGVPESLAIAGKLKLDGVNLPDIAQAVSAPFIPSQGLLSFDGTVNGKLPAPRLLGSWRVSDVAIQPLKLANLEFRGLVDPLAPVPSANGVLRLQELMVNRVTVARSLIGEVNYSADRGVTANLQDTAGGSDRLNLTLDPQFFPISLDAELAGSTLTVRGQERKLRVSLARLPLALINQNLAGRLSSELSLDLTQNLEAIGDIAVDQPRFGRAVLDRLSASVTYQNNQLTVSDGDLRFPDQKGIYGFQFTYNPRQPQPFQGELEITNGTIQDITAALQWNEWSDIARGLELPPASASAVADLTGFTASPNLYARIQYLAQLQARAEQQEIQLGANALFPPLSEFKGGLEGKISLTANALLQPTIKFDIRSRDLEYGKFAVEQFSAKGSYGNDTLRIDTLKLASGNSFAEISETVLVPALLGRPLSLDNLSALLRTEQKGKLVLANFPIESLRPFPFVQAIPFDLTGNVNGTASLSGSLASLKLAGKLAIANATINRQPLELVEGEFDFQNFLLKFQAKALVSGKEPLNAKGSLLVLGGLVDMQVDVKNEGLAFLNVLDQPVRWVSGKGNASLNIKGVISSPAIEGKVNLDNAQLAILGLNENLQEVKGELAFNRDRLTADLSANFSQGNFRALGAIALSDPQLILDNPLTINADPFSLNIRDLTAERCSARVTVRGTALSPVLTGEVLVGDGRLFLVDNGADPLPFPLGFENLKVRLENMQIVRPPVFNFVADGSLEINGTVQEIRPSGRVNFSRGQFNTIAARFRLDRSFDNYAEFIPSQGLNPNLNVRATTSVVEVTRLPVITDPVLGSLSPRDVPVNTQGAQSTLRVQATVTGSAENPNILLTSSPLRTQSELQVLVGGISPFTGTEATALANLAGGGILNLLQDALGEVLTGVEFNLNPVTTNPRGTQSTTLGLAAEAAIDFSNSFSAAVRTIINDPNEPTDYAIRYRLDPTIIFRANINSRGDRGASVEFETRF